MKLLMLVFGVALTVIAVPAHSASQQGDLPTVVGIQLGKPITLPVCPEGQTEPPASICYDNAGAEHVENNWWFMLPVGGTTPASIQPGGRIHVSDGMVDEIRIWTFGVKSQDAVVELLTKKFGKATSVKSRAVQNRLGAQYSSIFATWTRPGFRVTFDATWKDLDNGMIFVETDEHAAAQAAKMHEQSF